MRLFELVDSDQQLLDLVKPILIRAKAEGADSVDMQQLVNDIGANTGVSPSALVDVINRHRQSLKNIITSANLDVISLDKGPANTTSTKADQQANKFNDLAVKKALDKLK
jgi:hypothetical protein